MADYFTQICFAFSPTTAEADHFNQLVTLDFEGPEDPLVPDFLSDRFANLDQLAEYLFDDAIPYIDRPGFDGESLYFSSEQADPEILARAIQLCCPSILPFGFEWANTCSRDRLDAFGGGCVAIFPDRIEIETTSMRLHQLLNP